MRNTSTHRITFNEGVGARQVRYLREILEVSILTHGIWPNVGNSRTLDTLKLTITYMGLDGHSKVIFDDVASQLASKARTPWPWPDCQVTDGSTLSFYMEMQPGAPRIERAFIQLVTKYTAPDLLGYLILNRATSEYLVSTGLFFDVDPRSGRWVSDPRRATAFPQDEALQLSKRPLTQRRFSVVPRYRR